jgi:hypothetical protein
MFHARQARANRTQIGDVHENDFEDGPAGRGFELGLCRGRAPWFRHAR